MKLNYTDHEFRMITNIFIVVFFIAVFSLGFLQGFKYGRRPQTKIEKRIPCGYTAINYDSVRWSDGGKTEYNWHTKKR